MKCLFILIIAVLGFFGSHAQSMFEPIPKPAAANSFAKITIVDSVPSGSNYIGFRFTGPTVMYAVTPKSFSESTLYTLIGIDYENDYWSAANNKTYSNYAIGLQVGEGGQIAPSSLSAVTAAALTFSTQKIGSTLLPFKLTIGAIYNFTTHTGQAGVGPGIPLNN